MLWLLLSFMVQPPLITTLIKYYRIITASLMKNFFKSSFFTTLTLTLIISLGVFLRFYHLDQPSVYVFDEVYHVPTVKLIAKDDPRAYEWWHLELVDEIQSGAYVDWLHPPLAKLIQAGSLLFFGDNAWAWRAPAALAGSLLILTVFGLARALWPQAPAVALGAASLAAIDGLAIAQSRLAMNDIFVTLFMTFAVWAYFRYLTDHQAKRWLLLTGLSTGLALASKWSGIWLFGFFVFWELGRFLLHQQKLLNLLRFGILVGLFSIFIYLLSYWQLFIHHPWSHFVELNRQILAYQTGLTETHPYSSKAWTWPLALRPVYLYAESDGTGQIWNRPFYPSWFFGLAGLVLALFSLLHLCPRTGHSFTLDLSRPKIKLFFLLSAYFCFWVPWIFSPRIMFFHHYLPALPMLWILACGSFHDFYQYFLQSASSSK